MDEHSVLVVLSCLLLGFHLYNSHCGGAVCQFFFGVRFTTELSCNKDDNKKEEKQVAFWA